jgi:hypothetical protein
LELFGGDPTRTVGDLGIVEPFLGLAIEHRLDDTTPFPTDIPIPSSPPTTTTINPSFISPGGRTLGAAPTTFTPLNRPRSSSPRHTQTLNLGSSDDEDLGGARGNKGKEVVMAGTGMLPGTYPRSPTGVRSSSAERFGERKMGSFNARFTQPAKEERVKGTTGLNNLGKPSAPPCRSLCVLWFGF